MVLFSFKSVFVFGFLASFSISEHALAQRAAAPTEVTITDGAHVRANLSTAEIMRSLAARENELKAAADRATDFYNHWDNQLNAAYGNIGHNASTLLLVGRQVISRHAESQGIFANTSVGSQELQRFRSAVLYCLAEDPNQIANNRRLLSLLTASEIQQDNAANVSEEERINRMRRNQTLTDMRSALHSFEVLASRAESFLNNVDIPVEQLMEIALEVVRPRTAAEEASRDCTRLPAAERESCLSGNYRVTRSGTISQAQILSSERQRMDARTNIFGNFSSMDELLAMRQIIEVSHRDARDARQFRELFLRHTRAKIEELSQAYSQALRAAQAVNPQLINLYQLRINELKDSVQACANRRMQVQFEEMVGSMAGEAPEASEESAGPSESAR